MIKKDEKDNIWVDSVSSEKTAKNHQWSILLMFYNIIKGKKLILKKLEKAIELTRRTNETSS